MKLSEAIRLGAMLKPQAHLGFFDGQGTCAIGAANDAIGHLNDLLLGRFVEFKEWPVFNMPVTDPVTQWPTRLWDAVVTLNDTHRWTRERIAAWVEGIESQQDVLAVPEPASCEPPTTGSWAQASITHDEAEEVLR